MNKSFAEIDLDRNGTYLNMLSCVCALSKLFSDSSVPYLNYRVAENVFCNSFKADNLSRSDTAYDARYNDTIGVGLKTFVISGNSCSQKIAEFNSLSRDLSRLKGKALAVKLAQFRNDRIDLANKLYGVDTSMYHIVARSEEGLFLFETEYDKIDIDAIGAVVARDASLSFEDNSNSYSFNYSKSTLFRRFNIPKSAHHLPVGIIGDPYTLLLNLFESKEILSSFHPASSPNPYVILPLYGRKGKEKFVFEKSGLNLWNAGGRSRNCGEVYIPIPIEIHKKCPDFFPNRDVTFDLKIPTGEVFSAKVCQDNRKALMTNPNSKLECWLLRKLFRLNEGELLTIDRLNQFGFDSVVVTKIDDKTYSIDKAALDSYESFVGSF